MEGFIVYGDERLPERIWSKIEVNLETECWEWIAYRDPEGYGRSTFEGQTMAHRITYQALVGPIPQGKQLDHLCRVRHCVNPDHLEPVTHAINQLRGVNTKADRAWRERMSRGGRCGRGGHPIERSYLSKGGVLGCLVCQDEFDMLQLGYGLPTTYPI